MHSLRKRQKEEKIMVEKITDKNKLKRNGSGYNDPTAYKAIMNVGGGNSNEYVPWRYFLYRKHSWK